MSTLALPADLLGGAAGLSLHSASCPDGTNNAQPGAMGISQSPWGGPPQGMTIEPAAIVQQPSDTIACLGEIVQLPVDVTGADLLYQWQILIEGTWTDLQEGAVHGGVQSPTLFIAGLINPMAQYRLIVTREGDCPLTLMSEPIQVSGTAPPTADPVFVLSGTEVSFTANAELTDQYLWSFGDASGTTSSEANPAFTYAGPGTYNVTLMVTNSCGTQDYGLQIVIGSAPEAAFTASRLEGCSPLEVTFTSTSTGTVDALSWSFPGGMPASSTEAAPMVSFPAPGLYIVTLIVENDFGSSEATVEVEVFPTPQVDFNFSVDGLTVSFFNASLDATTYTWNFGDGLTSTAINPVHSYGEPGVYEVTLNAQNASCGTAASKQVGVMVNQTDHPSGAPQQRIYPNPSTGLLVLEGWAGYELTVLNVHGQWLQQNQIQGDQESLQLTHLPAGVYWLRFTRAGEEVYERWVKW